MLNRQLSATLQRLADSFPIVAVTGPRQSGKTTLTRAIFADKPYVRLEDPTERAFAQEDPRGFQRGRSLTRRSAGPNFFRICNGWWMQSMLRGGLY